MGARLGRGRGSWTNQDEITESPPLSSSCSPLRTRLFGGRGAPVPGDSALFPTHIAADDVRRVRARCGRKDRQDSPGRRRGFQGCDAFPRRAEHALFRFPVRIQRACRHGSPDMVRTSGRVRQLVSAGILALLCVSGYAADSPCAACHPKQVEGYLKTGMGRSLSRSYNQPLSLRLMVDSCPAGSLTASRSHPSRPRNDYEAGRTLMHWGFTVSMTHEQPVENQKAHGDLECPCEAFHHQKQDLHT